MEEYISSLPHPQSIDQLKNLYNFLLKNKELLTVKTTFHSLTHTFYFQNEKLMTLATDLFLKAETTDHDFNYLNSLIGEIVYKKPKFYPKFLTLLEIKTFRYLENNPAEISACILTTLTKRSPSFKKVLTNSIERKCTSNSKEIEGCLPFLKKENCPIELIHDILMIIYTHKDKIDHKERMEGLEKQAYEIFWDNFEKLKILNSRSFFNIAENILEFETSEKRRKKLLALFADKPARSTAIVSEEALMEILNGLTGSSKHAKFLFKELNEESK